ncbi:hypothetical protein ACFCZ1_08645 [Streptomyces sp. NPDC056224]|uniref:hypothetical protein n=1 Tax=Streptomyces sp. NPDC056224 TaxID=3345750 RepID=UPI0035DAD795
MPPPRRNRTGLVVGIVVAALVVLGGVGAGARSLAGASGTGSFPAAEYKLTVPKTLLDGQYELQSDESAEAKEEAASERAREARGARNSQPVIAQYEGASAAGTTLTVTGLYGQFKDTDVSRDGLLSGATKEEGVATAVPAKDVRPAGAEMAVRCQVLVVTDEGVKSTMPMCAWGDANTAAWVAVITPEIVRQTPQSVVLESVARTTLKVRTEMRRPLDK